MSHFTVLVIGPNPVDQLAPFQENNMDDCPRELLAFVDIEDEHLKKYTEHHTHEYSSFEEYMKLYYGQDDRDSIKNRYGYWENPNAKWDWYVLGGRWTGYFKMKEGARGVVGRPGVFKDQAPIGTSDSANLCDIEPESIGPTFAVVKDGKWYERGGMGWFGCVTNEMSEEEWGARFKELVAGLPDNTLLSLYDCHI